MNKKLTLLTASLIALYGCGGGDSSSGSTSNHKGPNSKADYPIQNSQFSPSSTTSLTYAFELDEQLEDEMSMVFQPLDSQEMVTLLEKDTDNEELLAIVHDLINYGITQFYLSEEVRHSAIEESEHTVYFAGSDGALHEITDAYFIGSEHITEIMESSPLFRLNGVNVVEGNPIIDISNNTVSLQVTLTGKAVVSMLSEFESHPWVQNLPYTASCSVNWQQLINETGVRKAFTVSGKSIEAANLSEDNTYDINCADMDSMHFSTSSQRWFNPSIGLISQIELLESEGVDPIEEKATLTSIDKVL